VIPHGNELIELTYHATPMRRMEGKRQGFRLVQLMLNLFFISRRTKVNFTQLNKPFSFPSHACRAQKKEIEMEREARWYVAQRE
jgi:hypothetical protein